MPAMVFLFAGMARSYIESILTSATLTQTKSEPC